MFKLQARDKDLFRTIFAMAIFFGVMLAMMSFIGEQHGLVATVVILMTQIAFLLTRVHALERKLGADQAPPKTGIPGILPDKSSNI